MRLAVHLVGVLVLMFSVDVKAKANLCLVKVDTLGLGQILVFQHSTSVAAPVVKALTERFAQYPGVALPVFVGLRASDDWSSCQDGSPDRIYWRDPEGNWADLKESAKKMVRSNLRETGDLQRQAYFTYVLARIELSRNQIRKQRSLLRKAFKQPGSQDRYAIKYYVMKPLVYDMRFLMKHKDEYLALRSQVIGIPKIQGRKTSVVIPEPTTIVTPVPTKEMFQNPRGGWVIAELTILTNGQVSDVRAMEYSHPDFIDTSVEALSGAEYPPILVDGVPQTVNNVQRIVTYEFR